MSHRFGNLCNHMEKTCDIEVISGGRMSGEEMSGEMSWEKHLRENPGGGGEMLGSRKSILTY